jgi:hypothetical protein
MASGPEHYREAESLLAEAKASIDHAGPGRYSASWIAMAAVHARLAQAADAGLVGDMDDPDFEDQVIAWREVTAPTQTEPTQTASKP